MKICKICGKEKALNDFPIRGVRADGSPSYRNYCKECWLEVHRSQNKAYRERQNPSQEWDEVDKFITVLGEYTGYSIDNLETVTKDEFLSYCTNNKLDFTGSFTELKERTFSYFDKIGIGNPAYLEYTEDGNYLVIGDTFGMHTRSSMFSLIHNIVRVYNVNAVICIGRQLDEHDNISNCFEELAKHIPVVFVATQDEITKLHALNDTIHASIVREYVSIGDVTVCNQEQITPYVKRSLNTLDPYIYSGDCVVNCTRTEFANRYSNGKVSFVASPGSIAERHVRKVINKLLLKEGRTVANCLTKSFHKYRKNEEDVLYWNQGCIMLNKKGSSVLPVMLPIKKVDGSYVTAYDGVVISDTNKVFDHIKTDVIVSDIHTPQECTEALKAVLSYLHNRSLDNFIYAGDISDGNSMNHHIISKGRVPEYTYKEELLSLSTVLNAFDSYCTSDKVYYLMGNHEDFIRRHGLQSVNKSITDVLEESMESVINEYVDCILEHDEFVSVDNVTIMHGSTDIAVSGCSNTEKMGKAFGESIIGHSHSSEMRLGCVRMGCLCKPMDYTGITRWDYSIGTITCVEGIPFVALIRLDSQNNYRITDLFNSYDAHDNIIITPMSSIDITIEE